MSRPAASCALMIAATESRYCSRNSDSPRADLNDRPFRFMSNHSGRGYDPVIAVGSIMSRVTVSIGLPPGSVEHQHGPCDLACLHCPERLVDVAEPAASADHLIQLQPALTVELQVVRDVGAELVGAHAGGLHAALGPDRHPRELDHR